MTAAETTRPVVPGDLVEIASRRVGDAARTGEILAVLGEGDHLHYLVRWNDGHESTLYSGEGTTIRADAFATASAD